MRATKDERSVTVAIPVRNGAATIGEQLEALCDQAGDCVEIVVADNGSTDATLAVIRRFLERIPNLRVIDAANARGVAAVRNVIAAATSGDLLWCDADDVVAPGWIRAMTLALDEFDLVGGRIEEAKLNGPTATWLTSQHDRLPIQWNYLPFTIGANMAMRRSVVDDIGGWDRRLGGVGEDIDFCWRALYAGCRLGFEPHAVVHYRHRRSRREIRRQQWAYGRDNAQLHRLHRSAGLPRGSLIRLPIMWAKVMVLFGLSIVRPDRRSDFHRLLANSAGNVYGAIVHRAWPY